MLNTYKVTLNIDKNLREFNPPIVHRISDMRGVTIAATIKIGTELATGLASPIFVANFRNGESVIISGTVSDSTATVTLNNTFNGNLGVANCYFKFGNYYTTQDFKIAFIDSVHFIDSDYTWINSGFKSKITGDLKSNPNMLVRAKTGGYAKQRIGYSIWYPEVIQNLDMKELQENSIEADQRYYDALQTGFYGKTSFQQNELSIDDSNFLTNDKNLDWHNVTEIEYFEKTSNSDPRSAYLYSYNAYNPIARFKVPDNVNKIRVNNILFGNEIYQYINADKDDGNMKEVFYLSYDENIAKIPVFGDDGLTNTYYAARKKPNYSQYKSILDVDGVSSTDSSLNLHTLAFDTSKVNVIDKYGYFDINQKLGVSLYTGKLHPRNGQPIDMNCQHFYPQINIDYAYLDLS